jgi:hypothetical protein
MADPPVPQVDARSALRDMIPALLGQTYLVALVGSGHLDYLQATVGITAEMLIGPDRRVCAVHGIG